MRTRALALGRGSPLRAYQLCTPDTFFYPPPVAFSMIIIDAPIVRFYILAIVEGKYKVSYI